MNKGPNNYANMPAREKTAEALMSGMYDVVIGVSLGISCFRKYSFVIIYRSVNDLNVFKIRHAVNFDSNSKIAQRVYQHDHSMDFENVKIIDRARNYHKRLFLEA